MLSVEVHPSTHTVQLTLGFDVLRYDNCKMQGLVPLQPIIEMYQQCFIKCEHDRPLQNLR